PALWVRPPIDPVAPWRAANDPPAWPLVIPLPARWPPKGLPLRFTKFGPPARAPAPPLRRLPLGKFPPAAPPGWRAANEPAGRRAGPARVPARLMPPPNCGAAPPAPG